MVEGIWKASIHNQKKKKEKVEGVWKGFYSQEKKNEK